MPEYNAPVCFWIAFAVMSQPPMFPAAALTVPANVAAPDGVIWTDAADAVPMTNPLASSRYTNAPAGFPAANPYVSVLW